MDIRNYINQFPTLPDEISVYDNIVSNEVSSNILYNSIYNVNWNLGSSYFGSSGENINDNKTYEQLQFSENILMFNPANTEDVGSCFMPYKGNPYNYIFLTPLINLISKLKFNLQFQNIMRCKINLQTRTLSQNKGKFNKPHTDFDFVDGRRYLTAIYYVNDCDGDTFIFNEKVKEENSNKLSVKKIINPKKGRIVLFRGDSIHAGSNPIESNSRFVINYNFIPFNIEETGKKLWA